MPAALRIRLRPPSHPTRYSARSDRPSASPTSTPAPSCAVRRSTVATSTPASASSPASIRPVGPPPTITTACLVIATSPPGPLNLEPFLRELADLRRLDREPAEVVAEQPGGDHLADPV